MNLRSTPHPYRRTANPETRVPVVLPQVQVHVLDDGSLDVLVDHEDVDEAARRTRDDLPGVVEEIAARLGSAVRVEVHEADGTVYTDIATPDTQARTSSERAAAAPLTLSAGELGGNGFLPKEEVAVAVVVAHKVASADGTARLHLPPAVLAGAHGDVLLLGRASGTVAAIAATS